MLLLARKPHFPKAASALPGIAITTGSVMSPIGNPQNLLIALGGKN